MECHVAQLANAGLQGRDAHCIAMIRSQIAPRLAAAAPLSQLYRCLLASLTDLSTLTKQHLPLHPAEHAVLKMANLGSQDKALSALCYSKGLHVGSRPLNR